MRIRIETEPLGPLKVLEELPDARLALMEGLNGIGKTLAVRVMELCSGSRPYPVKSPAWQSFCNGVGPVKVSVRGLHGAREIQWIADTREWLTVSDDGRASVAFHQILIDNQPASVDQVRRLLAVYRIGGEEGIVETLARMADTAAETIHRWATRYADQTQGPLAQLEGRVSQALALLGNWSGESYADLVRSLEKARSELAAATKASEEAQRKRNETAAALAVSKQLEDFRQRAPDLAKRLAAVDGRISSLRAEREEVQRKLKGLASQMGGSRAKVKELFNARRTVHRDRLKLAKALNAAATAAAFLEIGPERAACSKLITRLEEQVAQLSEEQTALDSAPPMRDLLDRLGSDLTQAEAHGLGEQIAIEDPAAAIQLTVSQTRAGMAVRRAYLEGKPPPPVATEVAEKLETAKRSLDLARDLDGLLREADRQRRLVSHNEDRVSRALHAINPSAIAQMQRLETQRRQDDDTYLELAAERAALAQQLAVFGDAATEESLRLRLQQSLEQLSLEESKLPDALAVAELVAHRAEMALTDAHDQEESRRRELAQANAEIRRSRQILANDAQLGWLRSAVPEANTSSAPGDGRQQLAIIDSAHRKAAALNERLGELRGQLGAIESGLQGVGRHLRGDVPETPEYLGELQAWFGERFSEWFNNPRLRSQLLPRAKGPIMVDVKSREVIWRENGSTLSRPIEAFSSGEQVLAYTRARLARLDEEQDKALNRLIVLDEFGAFMAHDLLAGLLAYLRNRAKDYPNDQVLVVLPLNRDYEDLAKSALDDEAEKYDRLAKEVESRKYAVQSLES